MNATIVDLGRVRSVSELADRIAAQYGLGVADSVDVCRRARHVLREGRSAANALAAAGQLARSRAGITPFSPLGGAA